MLAAGGLATTGVVVAVIFFVVSSWLGTPVPVFGFGDGPDQPIAFPHPTHAGTAMLVDDLGNPRLDPDGVQLHGLGLDCTFCHRTVTRGATAGVPPVQVCTFCHKVVGSKEKVELEALRGAGLEPFVGAIDWQRVHRLPDHVRFVHEPHIRFLTIHPASIDNNPDVDSGSVVAPDGTVAPAQVCSTCHGDVKTMQKVKQVEPLKMGQCVNCHRDNGAPTDCATCHF